MAVTGGIASLTSGGQRGLLPGMAGAVRSRSAVVVTGEAVLSQAVAAELRVLRWTVREARGAAEMFTLLDAEVPELTLMDSWLPDLEVRECVRELRREYPALDVMAIDGADIGAGAPRSAFRAEVLHALRQAEKSVDRSWDACSSSSREAGPEKEDGVRVDLQVSGRAAGQGEAGRPEKPVDGLAWQSSLPASEILRRHGQVVARVGQVAPEAAQGSTEPSAVVAEAPLAEFVGTDPRLLEVSRRIRLVAHRKTPVLVHGETGTGKELVARAIHRLSGRPADRFVAINCAAIPEALVEAELFGHARGAFTGAVGSRVGRIEAAANGTLFLDEIGELPLTVQSKLLRFLENGEIQRVGENEAVRVDARVVAATHRKLGAMAKDGTFRLDLLHRLSVFLVQTPSLEGRHADIDALIEHRLTLLGREEAPKQLSEEARLKLHAHAWPGNVRELEHAVERAWILAGPSRVIDASCVDFGEALF